jgi:small multidrug resistance pump
MDKIFLMFIIGVGLSLITVIGDLFVKHASLQSYFSGWKWLLIGAIIYGITAFGWFFVMREIKLSTLGVIYSVSCVLLLTFAGIFYFKEKVSNMEIMGIIFAIVSLVLLAKFE